MRHFIEEFKAFAVRGNVIDLAVAVIIGGAFGKMVTSFVGDLIMPLLGMLTSEVNFSELTLTLRDASETTPAITLNYGAFVDTIVQFTIISFAIFLAIKQINRFKKPAEQQKSEPTPAPDVALLTEIRDLLKAKRE